jgi:hypothetical protein
MEPPEPTTPNQSSLSIRLTRTLTEREKALYHLVATAMDLAISVIQHGKQSITALADTNDLAFRRTRGQVDVDLGQAHSEQTKLIEAARAFVEIEQAEAAEAAQPEEEAAPSTDFLIFANGCFVTKIGIPHIDDARAFITGCNEGVLISEAYEGQSIATFTAEDPKLREHITEAEITKALAAKSSQPRKLSDL